MAPDPVLHERIYAALKAEIRSGHLRPASHIDLQQISSRYRASVTPVREVVWRLIGERLAEARQNGGYRTPVLHANHLRDLYALNALILDRGIRSCTDSELDGAIATVDPPAASADAKALATFAAALFESIGCATGNGEILRAIDNLNDRLAAARIAESLVLPNFRREMLTLSQRPEGPLKIMLARRIARYHRRRSPLCEAIARQTAGSPDG